MYLDVYDSFSMYGSDNDDSFSEIVFTSDSFIFFSNCTVSLASLVSLTVLSSGDDDCMRVDVVIDHRGRTPTERKDQ